jgi:hypothetical protein
MDDNIVLNYTAIDFTGGNQNIFECKKKSKGNITWSIASIDESIALSHIHMIILKL